MAVQGTNSRVQSSRTEKKLGTFDVLKVMCERNLDIRLSTLDNVRSARKVKGGTEIKIGFFGDVVTGIAKGRFCGGLLLADFKQFQEIKKEVESQTQQSPLPTNKPKVITMCGSSRYVDVMAVCGWLIERDERAIVMGLHLLPDWYPNCPDHHLAEAEGVAPAMDELHLRKIAMSDEIFVVNVDEYIGESTAREIETAKSLGKNIRWFTHDQIGEKVRAMFPESKLEKSPPQICKHCRAVIRMRNCGPLGEAWADLAGSAICGRSEDGKALLGHEPEI